MELDQEVAELQSLIQALGEQMQQGHAAGQDALEGLRLRLTKEHDEVGFYAFPSVAMLT